MSKTAPETGEPAPDAATLLLRGPRVFLVPAEGRRVRKPGGAPLAEAGEAIDVDADWVFWARRASDGDVIVGEDPIETGDPK